MMRVVPKPSIYLPIRHLLSKLKMDKMDKMDLPLQKVSIFKVGWKIIFNNHSYIFPPEFSLGFFIHEIIHEHKNEIGKLKNIPCKCKCIKIRMISTCDINFKVQMFWEGHKNLKKSFNFFELTNVQFITILVFWFFLVKMMKIFFWMCILEIVSPYLKIDQARLA